MIEVDPLVVGDETLTAEIVIKLFAGIVAGGVYTPALLIVPTEALPPVTPFTFHVTVVSARLLTLAVSGSTLPIRTWLPPLTVIDGGEDVAVVVDFPHPLNPRTLESARIEREPIRCGWRKADLPSETLEQEGYKADRKPGRNKRLSESNPWLKRMSRKFLP